MKSYRAAPISSIFPAPSWPVISHFTAKELRVTVPIALWGTVLVVLAAMFNNGPISSLSFGSFPIICSAIGAMAAGHDFTHRTLGMMLALPMDRATIWRTRLALAFLVMVPVGLLGATMSFLPIMVGHYSSVNWSGWALSTLTFFSCSILNGLFLAPWLTLISRSPLFGTVFSLACPFLVATLANFLIRFRAYENEYAATFLVWSTVMPAIWITTGILGYRKFVRLEVMDGGAVFVSAPSSKMVSIKARPQNPFWQLLKKELFLQRMALGLTVVVVVIAFALRREAMILWTLSFPVFLCALIGSAASADERQMGTAEWQIMLPMAFSAQWLTKLLVTLGTALLCAAIVPLSLLKWAGWFKEFSDADTILIAAGYGWGTILATSISLHLSTLCKSTLKALLASLPLLAAIGAAIGGTYTLYVQALTIGGHQFPTNFWSDIELWPLIFLTLGVIPMSLRFAMTNHRYVDHGRGARGWRHALWFLGYLLFGWGILVNLLVRVQ